MNCVWQMALLFFQFCTSAQKTSTTNNSYPPMSTNIESHLIENRVFKPRKDFSKKAHISSLARVRRDIS